MRDLACFKRERAGISLVEPEAWYEWVALFSRESHARTLYARMICVLLFDWTVFLLVVAENRGLASFVNNGVEMNVVMGLHVGW